MTQAAPRPPLRRRLAVLLAVFGPATITAMADNDAGGVATYSVAGATLGYPILFPLLIITVLLAITQEMGMRLTVVTGKGLADLIRERFGVKVSMLIFASLVIANMGTLITELSSIKVTSQMLHVPGAPAVILMVGVSYLLVSKGNYKLTQNIMLLSCFLFLAYIISAFRAKPDWGLALGNLFYPHGVQATPEYLRNYLIIGMGVLGTTITPWGQFFVSSFSYAKKIAQHAVAYAQAETYWGAFLTNFFSFFMIVATAATLFAHGIKLVSGEQAALAIQPFAGKLAGVLFAVGILNAGFMGLVVVSLCTAYAFAEFFGIAGSLNESFKESRLFYTLYLGQLVVAAIVVMFPGVSLFQLAVTTQVINAMCLPLALRYLIKLTSDRELMGRHVNTPFQRKFASIAVVVIIVASVFTVGAMLFGA